MDFTEILSKKVKPELNHIYTKRPGFSPLGGRDLGWFCREHALHLYGLARLLKEQADICLGDFILYHPEHDSYHSVGDTRDHAWCSIGHCTPIDIRLTVRHIYPKIPDVTLIHGSHQDLIADFDLQYHINAPDKEFLNCALRTAPLIAYNEKVVSMPLHWTF